MRKRADPGCLDTDARGICRRPRRRGVDGPPRRTGRYGNAVAILVPMRLVVEADA